MPAPGLSKSNDHERTPPGSARSCAKALLQGDPKAPARGSLVRRIRVTRDQGYEEHVSETLPGITDLCLPIVDRSGRAIATLTQPYLCQRDVTVTVAQARAAHARTVQAISHESGATSQDAA